jgi:hypothetical protein
LSVLEPDSDRGRHLPGIFVGVFMFRPDADLL